MILFNFDQIQGYKVIFFQGFFQKNVGYELTNLKLKNFVM